MKNKFTRKLMLSILTLAFAVVSLGASTFAWFTVSKSASVTAFSAQVKAGEGIEIAATASGTVADDTMWYTGNLPETAVKTACPALTADADNDGNPDFRFDALTTSTGNSFQNAASAAATTGYLQFYIHIRAAAAGNVKLDAAKVTFSSDNVNPFTADQAYKTKKGDGTPIAVNDKVTDKIENAARLSLKVVSGATSATFTGYNNALGVYEAPEGASESNTANAITVANTLGGTLPSNAEDTANLRGAHQYYYVKTGNLPQNSITSALASANLKAGIAQYDSTQTGQIAQNILTLCVSVWIEGNDWECMNALFNQTLSVQFELEFGTGE